MVTRRAPVDYPSAMVLSPTRSMLRRRILADTMEVLPRTSTERMTAAFGTVESGIRIASSAEIQDVGITERRFWCCVNGVYQVPTLELAELLVELAAGRNTVEICAGHVALGNAIGVVSTDSYMQTEPEIEEHFMQNGQRPIVPPECVERFEACDAAWHFRPEVVFGCYVTERRTFQERKAAAGSSFGVDELALFQVPTLKRYIVVGNEKTHGWKYILKYPHRVLHKGAPWLVTRSRWPEKNLIYVWDEEGIEKARKDATRKKLFDRSGKRQR